MKLGIVGLPNVGKSTLFNAITNAGAESANYPFCTIEPNVGVVPVPDERLDRLCEIYHPEKRTPAVIEFLDIAGLVKGASNGEGLGNKFLSHIREVDAIVHVVRCFIDDDIVHVDGSMDPVRDVETINMELALSDIEQLEKRSERIKKMMKGDKTLAKELDFVEKLINVLNSGENPRLKEYDETERALISQMGLLSLKPVIYVANVSDSMLGGDLSDSKEYTALREYAEKEGSSVIPICAQIEADISDMDEKEKEDFLSELGIDTETGLEKLIKESYSLLGLMSFLTAGPKEVRAWTIKKGTKAPQAAGKIHSDFERGFIRAEVVSYDDLIECGSVNAVKEKGLMRSEGKDYVIRDGDVVLFRFNV